MSASVIVVGTGIVGLSSAIHLAERGIDVILVGTSHAGEASTAAAGMLTPSVETELKGMAQLSFAARDGYERFVKELEERTGLAVPLHLNGALRIALDEEEAEMFRQSSPTSWLTPAELSELEPYANAAFGALLFPQDGSVEVPALMDAMRSAIASHPKIKVVREDVTAIEALGAIVHVDTNQGTRLGADELVLAAGAWSPQLLPHQPSFIRIEPIRGQIVEFTTESIISSRVLYGGSGYIVPRSGNIVVAGSTSERSGFDPSTTPEGLEFIEANARLISPFLSSQLKTAHWAGLRPVTPDWMPIIGRDPIITNITYACGHSRNGILLGPITGDLIAGIIMQENPTYDLYQFRPERF